MSIRTYFENIADAIREKNDNVATVTPSQMPQAIRDISTGFNRLTSNDIENITPFTGGNSTYTISKINDLLGISINPAKSELDLISIMDGGWSNTGYYNSENQTGFYCGFTFDPKMIKTARAWISRYVYQNNNQTGVLEVYKNNEWVTVASIDATTTIPYPVNYYDVDINDIVEGIRIRHTSTKSSNNNYGIGGLTLYG